MARLLAVLEKVCNRFGIELLPDVSDECWVFDESCIDPWCDCDE
jgi:hypothetical protein